MHSGFFPNAPPTYFHTHSDPKCEALTTDLTGEAMSAIRSDGNWQRWGKHYLLSLLNAHTRQVLSLSVSVFSLAFFPSIFPCMFTFFLLSHFPHIFHTHHYPGVQQLQGCGCPKLLYSAVRRFARFR